MMFPIIPAPCHSFIAFDKTSSRSEEKNKMQKKGAGFSFNRLCACNDAVVEMKKKRQKKTSTHQSYPGSEFLGSLAS